MIQATHSTKRWRDQLEMANTKKKDLRNRQKTCTHAGDDKNDERGKSTAPVAAGMNLLESIEELIREVGKFQCFFKIGLPVSPTVLKIQLQPRVGTVQNKGICTKPKRPQAKERRPREHVHDRDISKSGRN